MRNAAVALGVPVADGSELRVEAIADSEILLFDIKP